MPAMHVSVFLNQVLSSSVPAAVLTGSELVDGQYISQIIK